MHWDALAALPLPAKLHPMPREAHAVERIVRQSWRSPSRLQSAESCPALCVTVSVRSTSYVGVHPSHSAQSNAVSPFVNCAASSCPSHVRRQNGRIIYRIYCTVTEWQTQFFLLLVVLIFKDFAFWVPEGQGAKPLPAQGVSRYSTGVRPASQRAEWLTTALY